MDATLVFQNRLKYSYGHRLCCLNPSIDFFFHFFADETFTKFYSQSHQPLHVLLGKPVYLELRLKSPKPAATLQVHYCVAYPHSARNALVLLFEG